MSFTEVIVEPFQDSSPARVNVATGTLWLNFNYIGVLSADEWTSVIYHEKGHLDKKTFSEREADKVGSSNYYRLKLSPKATVSAMLKTMSFQTQEQIDRLNEAYQKAIEVDCLRGNKKACDLSVANFCGPKCQEEQSKVLQVQLELANQQKLAAEAKEIEKLRIEAELKKAAIGALGVNSPIQMQMKLESELAKLKMENEAKSQNKSLFQDKNSLLYVLAGVALLVVVVLLTIED